ncbi:MAG: hypothetical protein AAF602_19895 [Myxococcota bacterium]
MDVNHWFRTLWDVMQVDEVACLNLIQTVTGSREMVISLIGADLSALDALAYARTLIDLGRLQEAEEVFQLVLQVAFGM